MKVIVAGNWKMNHGPRETHRFFERFQPVVDLERVRLLLFPPAISLADAKDALGEESPVELGVQNLHWESSGALTGEVSARMAAEAGARFALIGHSERRHVFGETDSETALKVVAAKRAGVTPILCVGETLEQRREGRLEEVVTRQLDAVLCSEAGVHLRKKSTDTGEIILAYEPVWAIGTGQTANPKDAADAHGLLRARVSATMGATFAQAVPILYGGSVSPENTRGLLAASNVDGVLVGGASLDPESFARIASAAC
jgi:triosephosphate isomerase